MRDLTRIRGGKDDALITVSPCEFGIEHDISLEDCGQHRIAQRSRMLRTYLLCAYSVCGLAFFRAGPSLKVLKLRSPKYAAEEEMLTTRTVPGGEV
jgi:hypothetical protein